MGLSNHHCPLPLSSKIPQIPCQEVFGPAKGLLRRCLGVQTPTHKVFGRLGLIIPIIFGRIFAQTPCFGWVMYHQPFLRCRCPMCHGDPAGGFVLGKSFGAVLFFFSNGYTPGKLTNMDAQNDGLENVDSF